ncbi:hypothetical protein BLS_008534 [Venturia inaequalis]|uniref:Uncharacterized protein n=1 Tax=Venturia inaequalis TaxID=5025 RepID=A0A8H3U622_VENIN|nr:hypothetical protein BLS_008534 [Venturia inaequalis]
MTSPPDDLAKKLYGALNGRRVGPNKNWNNTRPKWRKALTAEIKKHGDLNEGKTEEERWEEVARVRKEIQASSNEESEDTEQESIDEESINEESTNEDTIKDPKHQTKTGGPNKKYTNEHLAWLWQWFQENSTLGISWYFPASLAFKQHWHRPDPDTPDYGIRNIYQAMKSSGHFEPGMHCDAAFYDVEANFPRKARRDRPSTK